MYANLECTQYFCLKYMILRATSNPPTVKLFRHIGCFEFFIQVFNCLDLIFLFCGAFFGLFIEIHGLIKDLKTKQ